MYSEVQLHVKSFRSAVLIQLPSFLHGFGRQGSSVDRYTQKKALKLAAAQKLSLITMPKLMIGNLNIWVSKPNDRPEGRKGVKFVAYTC